MESKIKKFSLIKSQDYPEYDLKITLKPSFRCNQNCWFCSEYDNKSKLWTKEECDLVLHKLSGVPDSKQKLFFYFYGGEPTLNKHWEYLNLELIKMFPDRELFIQTQTNLSIKLNRLEAFLIEATNIKGTKHTIDICSSYHLGKQDVGDFAEKMDLCKRYSACGKCFFSTEIPKERQMMDEFRFLSGRFPEEVKMKFTVIPKLKQRKLAGYEEVLEDGDLIGDDDGQYLEYRYYTRKYPELLNFLEQSWNFEVDGDVMNYVDIKHNRIHEKFKYMSCSCGQESLVVDQNLNTFKCNDDCYNNINPVNISNVDMSTQFSNRSICLNSECWDGLDFNKKTVTDV